MFSLLETRHFELDRNKLKTLVHYVCCKAEITELLGAVKLNKILFYIDFLAFKYNGEPVTGEIYIKRQFGPVPSHILHILAELEKEHALVIRDAPYYIYTKKEYLCLSKPDISLFTAEEIWMIDSLIDYILKNHTARSMSEISHDDIWEMAAIGEEIPYEAIFASSSGEIDETDIEWATKDIDE